MAGLSLSESAAVSADEAGRPAPARMERLDVLRGAAVLWMTAYHFCFDLDTFGLWRQDFSRDPFWVWQRIAIVGLFLFCLGMGQGLAADAGAKQGRFWRRWLQVAGCGCLVSAASYWMSPRTFIYFGVLHAAAVMLLVARVTVQRRVGLWSAGAAVLLLHVAVQTAARHPVLLDSGGAEWFAVLNQAPANILGLVSRKPVTADYVPLVPWLAAVWWGAAFALSLSGTEKGRRTLRGGTAPALRPLVWLGRHSLSWYMLHQPVLVGVLWLAIKA